jgi:hypothetical protein
MIVLSSRAVGTSWDLGFGFGLLYDATRERRMAIGVDQEYIYLPSARIR